MKTLHVFEEISINGKVIPCKIDTGAFSSSIDQTLVEGMPTYGSPTFFKNANGRQERRRVTAHVMFSCGIERDVIFSVVDRSLLKFPAIIGRRALEGIVVVVTNDERDPDNPMNVTKD